MLEVHFMDGMMAAFESVEKLIRVARNGRSQKDFAALLKIDQSMVSKYERGKVNPSIRVINLCMQMVHTDAGETAPSAEQLANRVRESLADPKLGPARSAISRLVDAFASENEQARTSGAAAQ
jgi:transcriptional regulator with XRE-family HTH domain